ncbi:MAG: hypothetical protein M0R75_06905 [Dehalococcoidia bacterium]|nr:hypothetical protein [Dehalococcoidia bacterium]
MAEVLPYAAVSWTQYVLDVGDEFVSYNLKRLNLETEVWDVIATIEDIETTDWLDYLAFPGSNSYRLTVTVDRLGAIIESDPDEVTGVEFEWRGLRTHEIQDASEWVSLQASTVQQRVEQGQTYRLAAGRRHETLFAGPLMARTLRLELIPEDLRDPVTVTALERLLDRQYTAGAVLCVRWGARPGARYIVQIDGGIDEALSGGLGRPSLPLRRVAMPEGWA